MSQSGHCNSESEAVREAIRDLAHENAKKGLEAEK
jgi:Arc/MetJ-type ribon-helix-helix transcriptional regulator